MKWKVVIFFMLASFYGYGQKTRDGALREQILASINRQAPQLTVLSDKIWALAETSLLEKQSSQLLMEYARQQGLTVTSGVAGMPTAFVAEYGSGKPIIGILGEYDALPGISQQAKPEKAPLVAGAAGHGCGHNLFGVGSLGAAVAIKELIAAGKLKGTVRFYGTPAEENYNGKVYMARAGLFNDLDVCLDWHPDSETAAFTQSSQAMVDIEVNFYGKAAHAAYDPWNGRSATDGMELFLHGLNMLREHVKPSVTMHYVIKSGGDVPNVVPEFAKTWVWIRDTRRDVVEEVLARVKKIAEGAGLMAEVRSEVVVNGGTYELLVNRRGAAVLQKNLELLGPILYTPEEETFARALQQNNGVATSGLNGQITPLRETREIPPGGSTDVGDVSWIVPEISLIVTTAPTGVPWHSWAVVACGGMSIGHKGMLYASKALALTMMDLYKNEAYINEIKEEFKSRKGNHVYKPFIPDGPPPVPDPE